MSYSRAVPLRHVRPHAGLLHPFAASGDDHLAGNPASIVAGQKRGGQSRCHLAGRSGQEDVVLSLAALEIHPRVAHLLNRGARSLVAPLQTATYGAGLHDSAATTTPRARHRRMGVTH